MIKNQSSILLDIRQPLINQFCGVFCVYHFFLFVVVLFVFLHDMPMCWSKQQKFERWELVANAAYDQDQAADWWVEAGYTRGGET